MLTQRCRDAAQTIPGTLRHGPAPKPRDGAAARSLRRFCLLVAGPAIILLCGVIPFGCSESAGAVGANQPRYAERATYVTSLGNLRTGQPASPTSVKVAVFLFGEEPEPPLGLVKPVELAATSTGVIVSDSALQATLQWTAGSALLDMLPTLDGVSSPSAVAVAPNGDRIIADLNGYIARVTPDNRTIQRYTAPQRVRPGGITIVGGELWVSNVLAHRIEIFDLAGGNHLRAIGQRGRGRGEFGLPMGLATTADGEVCVVDMLSARLQVLSTSGEWRYDVGGPGDRIGYFGRPKGVAIGPDGTIFVTDAASQRVHAFDRFGRPLITFGGAEDGAQALVLPAGVTVLAAPITAERVTPSDFTTAYCVLVAEQINRPGIRAYAWSGRTKPVPADIDHSATPRRVEPTVDNPHWQSTKCTTCHREEGGQLQPIAAEDVDAGCITCHDGRKAVAESHPVGWPAAGERTRAPEGWPLSDGRLACLTCHDIRKHCEASATRPDINSAMVRGFDAHDPTASCRTCHLTNSMRFNPHLGRAEGFSAAGATCAFCHVGPPTPKAGDEHHFDPRLRGDATSICLGCHTMHADPAPTGHLRKVVPPDMLARMARRENAPGATLAYLPLDEGKVSCSTCHNPHAANPEPLSLFRDPALTARSSSPHDERKALRIDHAALCGYCHGQ